MNGLHLIANFLGNNSASDYEVIVSNRIGSCNKMRCRMAIKLHLLQSHLYFFPENPRAVSNEQGKILMETRY